MTTMYGRRVTWQELKATLAADRARLQQMAAHDSAIDPRVSWRAVWLYRWSHYLHGRGRRVLGRLLWHANLTLSGADITPVTELGPGLVLYRTLGVTLFGRAGRNLTVCGPCVLGAGLGRRDVGAGMGQPLLGDDVTLGSGCIVLGPVRVGDGAFIEAGAVGMQDVPAGASLAAPAPTLRRRSAEPPAEPPAVPHEPAASEQKLGLRGLLRADRMRALGYNADVLGETHIPARRHVSVMFTPNMLVLLLHRLAHALWQSGWHGPAARLSSLNRIWHRIDIHPASRLGPAVYVPHPAGISLRAHAAGQLTLLAGTVVAGDPGSPPARWPVLGEDTLVGARACVHGAARIGAGARVGPRAVVATDVPPGHAALAPVHDSTEECPS